MSHAPGLARPRPCGDPSEDAPVLVVSQRTRTRAVDSFTCTDGSHFSQVRPPPPQTHIADSTLSETAASTGEVAHALNSFSHVVPVCVACTLCRVVATCMWS